MRYIALFIILISVLQSALAADKRVYPVHDGHIHYDQDVWQALPPTDAVRLLKQQNIGRALVSATPTEGAAMLYAADPTTVIPMLRPYKSWRHRYLWFNDPDLAGYIKRHLEKAPYRGLGEFHVFGQDADTLPMQQMIELARGHNLVLHPHTDIDGMHILLRNASDLVVIWAHGGFDVPVETLRNLLDNYPLLYIELSLREGMLDDSQQLTSEWYRFLQQYRTRFLVGADTYKPARWAALPEIVDEMRYWLYQLPDEVAADIARNNLDRLFPR